MTFKPFPHTIFGLLLLVAGPAFATTFAAAPGTAPVHVAIVEPKNCVADLIDLMDVLGRQTPFNNVTIITGPSKTADIEGALVVGVHGPGEVYTFVLQ